MGILDKLFGGKPQHAPLPDDSAAARQLERLREPLTSFVGQTKDNLEVVPSDQEVFIFVGSPPKRFGIVWLDAAGRLNNFKTLVSEKGVSPNRLQDLVQELGRAYQANAAAPRYGTRLGGRPVTVMPNAELATRISQVISAAVN